jgi:hypothetical protein
MVSELQATDIPRDRTDVLHLLRLHNDDLNELTPDQIAAMRSLYFLNDERTVAQLVREGEVHP